MSGQIPGIKEAGTTRRCSFMLISLTHSFRMATNAFICDVEDSEGSVGSLQLKQQFCSYTLLRVLVGVLAVLVLATTGGIIWMKLSQNCPERVWSVTVRENHTIFTAPRTEKYVIHGTVFLKETDEMCPDSFMLLKRLQNNTKHEISTHTFSQEFITRVNLEKGFELEIKKNCKDLKIDEAKSILTVLV